MGTRSAVDMDAYSPLLASLASLPYPLRYRGCSCCSCAAAAAALLLLLPLLLLVVVVELL